MYVQSHAQPGKPVILASGESNVPSSGWLLLGLTHYAPTWRGPVVLLDGPAPRQTMDDLSAAGANLAVVRAPDRSPAQLFANCLAGNAVEWPNVGTAWSIRWIDGSTISSAPHPRRTWSDTAPTPPVAVGRW